MIAAVVTTPPATSIPASSSAVALAPPPAQAIRPGPPPIVDEAIWLFDDSQGQIAAAVPPLEAPTGPSLGLAVTTTTGQVRADRPIRTEIFRPDSPGPHPGLLILHGASGVGDGEAAYLRATSEYFATQGFVVYLPHYLDQPARRGRAPAPRRQSSNVLAAFDLQAARIAATFNELSRHPAVDRDRLVVFGFSLGAFQGLTLAARDPRVRGIVSLGGGMPGNVAPSVTRLPATLVLHGGRDRIVPVARGRQVHDLAQRLRADAQIVVYADQGHFLRGGSGPDALMRSTRFLRASVNLPETSPTPPIPGVRTVRIAPVAEPPPLPPPARPAPRPAVRR